MDELSVPKKSLVAPQRFLRQVQDEGLEWGVMLQTKKKGPHNRAAPSLET